MTDPNDMNTHKANAESYIALAFCFKAALEHVPT
jgi:hypothetical protein